MIRDAQPGDLARIVEMGTRFINETSYGRYVRPNEECMSKLVAGLIENKGVLLSEQGETITGMLGFMIHRHFISGDIVAGEIFYWVEPEARGEGLKLLHEMEKRARQAGAKNMQMIAPTDKFARVLGRLHWDPVETTFQKNL